MNRPMLIRHWSMQAPITPYEIKWHDRMRLWRFIALLFAAALIILTASKVFSQTVETSPKPKPKVHATPIPSPDPKWTHV